MCQDIDLSFPSNAEDDDFDNLATALLDTKLLEAVQLINMDLKQETRQVILLGCGLDTRPHRYADLPAVCTSWCLRDAPLHFAEVSGMRHRMGSL